MASGSQRRVGWQTQTRSRKSTFRTRRHTIFFMLEEFEGSLSTLSLSSTSFLERECSVRLTFLLIFLWERPNPYWHDPDVVRLHNPSHSPGIAVKWVPALPPWIFYPLRMGLASSWRRSLLPFCEPKISKKFDNIAPNQSAQWEFLGPLWFSSL